MENVVPINETIELNRITVDEQRLGCVHGEELAYIFGAPLVPSLSHFGRNYTKPEVALSENVIAYWANFARNG